MAYSAFQEVVYAGRDEQLTAVFLNVDECLIGVHHLLQVDGLVAIVSEGISSVNFRSVSPMRPSWTSDTRLPALLSELANTISASGWLISRRMSSPLPVH